MICFFYNSTKYAFLFLLLLAYSQASAQDYAWAKSMGSNSVAFGGLETAYSIAVDASGNVYTTGVFREVADFDPGSGIFNLTSSGDIDIFVSKLDASGNFVWAKRMGGLSFDSGNGIAVDASGNVYITGYFNTSADFDPGAGTFNLTSAGDSDIFVSKLDASGNFVWAKAMGGVIGIEKGNSIAVDASGNVHVTGYFSATADFDPSAGIFNLTSSGNQDAFVSKLDTSGNLGMAIK